MKNIVIFILSICLVILTYFYLNTFYNKNNDPVIQDNVEYDIIDGWDNNFDNVGLPLDNFRINEKLAYDIGNSIIKSVYGENILVETDAAVYDIKGKDFYIVSRISKNKNVLGGGYSVAISKSDGKILRIWIGE